jgi:hypothetical protein
MVLMAMLWLRQLPFFHHRGLGLIPGQSMWDLWWTKWYWDRFFSKYFDFTVIVSFQQCSILIDLFSFYWCYIISVVDSVVK